jgi:hypothetical protein
MAAQAIVQSSFAISSIAFLNCRLDGGESVRGSNGDFRALPRF